MNRNYIFGNINQALPDLMGDLLNEGKDVGSRLGETTKEMPFIGLTLTEPWRREIVLPDRKASIAAQVAETMWVLAGRTDIEWLSYYLPRAVDFSDDGVTWRAGYGQRLRNYHGIDQLAYIVNTLQSSQGSRQAVATIWDPTVDTEPGKDIACNNWLDFLIRDGRLDLLVGIRSNDSLWGWSGINAFEWSSLQEIVAGVVGVEVGSLHFAVGSFHLYDRHWDRASKIAKQRGNFMYNDSPRFNPTGVDDMKAFDYLAQMWFDLEMRIRAGDPAQAEVEDFPEPMLQSWLRVLQWWWTGEHFFLETLRNTRLYEACKVGVQPKRGPVGAEGIKLEPPSFIIFVDDLHTAKHNAYGDSWKRRGEYMIMANIARKIDRLEGGADTPDETQTDTAIDLLVYLCKYDAWLNGESGDPADVRRRLEKMEEWHSSSEGTVPPVDRIVNSFEAFERINESDSKKTMIHHLMEMAYSLAHARWSA